MRVSVIVAVYKDVEALRLIIEALKGQTYKNFEVVVAEDGENEAMGAYVKSIEGLEVKHTTQEDLGVRKARSQNNAVLASDGEYLIFIDGDCVPYSTFVEGHVALAEKKKVLSGRRVNLPKKLSEMVKNKKVLSIDIEKNHGSIGIFFLTKKLDLNKE
jgi:glycosyltransferase involved in cell wall biosynthesis